MNVGELLDYLATQPRDRPVILASDAEGSSHSPLADAQESMYDADTTWSGDVYYTEEQLAELSDPDEYETAPDTAVRVVELGPVN